MQNLRTMSCAVNLKSAIMLILKLSYPSITIDNNRQFITIMKTYNVLIAILTQVVSSTK